jgi:hypothetical protein
MEREIRVLMTHTTKDIEGLTRLETFSIYNGQPFNEINPDEALDEESDILEELLCVLSNILEEQRKTNRYLAVMNNQE